MNGLLVLALILLFAATFLSRDTASAETLSLHESDGDSAENHKQRA